MEQFQKKLMIQQGFLGVGLLGLIAVFVFTLMHESAATPTGHFIAGFRSGISFALLLLFLLSIYRTAAAMKNPDKLRKLYVFETDERVLLIRQKAGSAGMNIVMYGFIIAAFIAGNFSEPVFFTLLGACLFVGLVRGFFKLYYRTKI